MKSERSRYSYVCVDGGRIAFITPSGWLDVAYATKPKEFLLTCAQVEALILFEGKHVFFPGVRTTAAISLIRKRPPGRRGDLMKEGGMTKVIQLGSELPDPEDVVASLQGKGPLPVERWCLTVERKWSRPPRARRKGIPLGDMATTKRGVATGCNGFFVL